MGNETWTVAEAKAKFSEVINKARNSGPQAITKHGRIAVVVVSAEEWKRKTHRPGNSPSSSQSRLCVVRGSRPTGRRTVRARSSYNFLLDTNVVSEWTKPRLDAGVVAWLAEADEDRVFVNVITVEDFATGACRPARDRLDTWLTEQVPQRFEGRLLASMPSRRTSGAAS